MSQSEMNKKMNDMKKQLVATKAENVIQKRDISILAMALARRLANDVMMEKLKIDRNY